jgi:ribonuclease P protein component
VSNPLFAAFCLARPGAEAPRLGVTATKALGGAVVRNRIKRRLKEVFRTHRSAVCGGWDIVLNPRRAAIEAPFGDLERALMKVISRCQQ